MELTLAQLQRLADQFDLGPGRPDGQAADDPVQHDRPLQDRPRHVPAARPARRGIRRARRVPAHAHRLSVRAQVPRGRGHAFAARRQVVDELGRPHRGNPSLRAARSRHPPRLAAHERGRHRPRRPAPAARPRPTPARRPCRPRCATTSRPSRCWTLLDEAEATRREPLRRARRPRIEEAHGHLRPCARRRSNRCCTIIRASSATCPG